MKKIKNLVRLICLTLCVALAFAFAGCGKSELETKLETALKNYVASESFSKSLAEVKSVQARTSVMYLKYLDKNFYTEETIAEYKKSLDLIDSLIDGDGKISYDLFESSAVKEAGFYSVTDYLYSYSLLVNQYALWCDRTANKDEKYDAYTDKIDEFLKAVDKELYDENVPFDYTKAGAAWGYTVDSEIMLTAYNLGLDTEATTPGAVKHFLSYYATDDSGNFVKEADTPNWNGFTGRPLAGSLLTKNNGYSAKYEKTAQGYFPYTDGWDQPLEEMINLDRLSNFYDKTITISEEVFADPEYALLTGMAHGFDMTAYEKAVTDETRGDKAGKKYDLVSMWASSLETDENGNYAIDNLGDAAVAIAYLAFENGIAAPSPLGKYTKELGAVKLS